MLVLDTQHVSRPQGAAPEERLRMEAILANRDAELRITVITPLEQLKYSHISIKSADDGLILPYDGRAASNYRSFDSGLIRRIGSMDARIFAIALAYGATVVTANVRDSS
jgi:predicted nucleic acid-binding protein